MGVLCNHNAHALGNIAICCHSSRSTAFNLGLNKSLITRNRLLKLSTQAGVVKNRYLNQQSVHFAQSDRDVYTVDVAFRAISEASETVAQSRRAQGYEPRVEILL